MSLNRGSRSAENVGILEFFVVTVNEFIKRCLMTVDEASVTSSLILTPFLLSDSTVELIISFPCVQKLAGFPFCLQSD